MLPHIFLHLLLPFFVLTTAAPNRKHGSETRTDTASAATPTISSSTTTSTTTPPTSYPTAPFTVISARSGSPIHLLPMNAAGQAFYLGGSPSTYCPLTNATLCPPGTVTAFLGLSALDTEVPGGQILYVSPSLAVGFTQAHSATIPPGAQVGGFTYTAPTPGTGELGSYSYSGFGASGFMGCPTADNRYQVFVAGQNATVPLGDVSKCLGFDSLTDDYQGTGAAAWQYT